jgi:hypothetical protein
MTLRLMRARNDLASLIEGQSKPGSCGNKCFIAEAGILICLFARVVRGEPLRECFPISENMNPDWRIVLDELVAAEDEVERK